MHSVVSIKIIQNEVSLFVIVKNVMNFWKGDKPIIQCCVIRFIIVNRLASSKDSKSCSEFN
jgi:hypothetical protein